MNRPRPSIPFLLELLSLAVRKEASAVYVVPWMPPTMRLDERVVALSATNFTPEQTAALVRDVLDDEQRAALDKSRQIQFSFVREGLGRFRVHAFRRSGQPAMAIRPYALPVPTLQSLALPSPLQQLALADRGLVVVASRSPTLRGDAVAALIDHRNRHGHGAILLLEDASRYWHDTELCVVEQGIGSGQAEERAMHRGRQPGAAPLAVAWGEPRDQPSLARAVRAATSALSFITLQADDVVEAMRALAQLGESAGDVNAVMRLAMAIEAVLALRRVAAQDGAREVAATELLLNSPDIAASFAERDYDAVRATMRALRGRGALSVDDHLLQLLANGTLGYDDALRNAADAADFARRAQAGLDAEAAAWAHPRPMPAAPAWPPAPAPARDVELDDLFGNAHVLPPGADTSFDSVDWPRSDHSLRDPFGEVTTPVRPAREGVQFRAYAPASMAPASSAIVDIWACLHEQEADVARLATAAGGDRAGPVRVDIALTRGTPITVQLRIEGLHVEQPAQVIAWHGEPANATFVVSAPAHTALGTHAARARLWARGLPIGELGFLIRVGREAESVLEDAHAARRMLRSAFASFAAEDRAEALARVQGLQAVAPALDVFVETTSLRAGDRWRERIERELGRRERLFLFWSEAASLSPWVDFEWRLALRTRGVDAIDPVPLADPAAVPPPPELAELRFGELHALLASPDGTAQRAGGVSAAG